jgi:hypothetical protein
VDANLPVGVFEKTPFVGFAILMSGTCVFSQCHKVATPAENTTEAEMDAANELGQPLRWKHLLMEDIGLPFDGPVPIAEDNSATQIIAQTSKKTRNVRHIALKALLLQSLVRERIALFRAVGSAHHKADHFTKALALPVFHEHCPYLMGLRFLTAHHAALVFQLRRESSIQMPTPTYYRRGDVKSTTMTTLTCLTVLPEYVRLTHYIFTRPESASLLAILNRSLLNTLLYDNKPLILQTCLLYYHNPARA